MGTWSDRLGKRKPFIAIGYILWGLCTIGFGATEFLPAHPFISAAVIVITADAIMSFFGSMAYDAGFNAWTTDISDESNRGRLGGAFAAMPVLATIFGAIVSAMIVSAFDFFPFFIMMGSLVIAMGIFSLFTLQEHPGLIAKRDERGYWHQFASVFNWKTVRSNQELFWVFILFTVYFIGFNVYFPYLTIYFKHSLNMSYSSAGLLQGLGLVAAVMLTFPAGKAIDRGKTILVVRFAILSTLAGLMILSAVTHSLLLLAGIFVTGTGYVLISQALTAWVKNLYPEKQRGQFEGIKQIFLVCIPMIFGPSLATIVIQNYGIQAQTENGMSYVPTGSLFLGGAAVILLTFLPLIPAGRLLHKRKARSLDPFTPPNQEDLTL